jgi:CIC family chloride channel protein
VFVKLLLWLRLLFKRLPKSTLWLQPVAGGLTVGLIGYFVPDVMGVGYNYVERVLNGDVVLKMVVLLAILKIVATTMCYSSGNAGGIFGPSLFIGAMMGATVGGVAHHFFPVSTAGPGAYALVGMGTAFAGIVRTPLTSVIMIFEVTRDYSIIVPLMISNLIAYYISYKLQREPIYEALAHQDGMHLPTADRAQSAGSRVARVMRPATGTFSPDTSVGDALAWLDSQGVDAWPVVNGDGLAGMIRRGDLERSATAGRIADLMQPAHDDFIHLHIDHSLSVALERIGASGLQVIPVVSRANMSQLIGVAVLDDILRAYGVKSA